MLKCLAENQIFGPLGVRINDRLNREIMCKILVEDLGEKSVWLFCSSFVNAGSKTSA
jgi:hypothetical protein